MKPREAQIQAQMQTGYGPIHLYRTGDKVIVAVQNQNGDWIPVIDEFFDGNFSHIVEPLGIKEAFGL
jgi:hypothetical protein